MVELHVENAAAMNRSLSMHAMSQNVESSVVMFRVVFPPVSALGTRTCAKPMPPLTDLVGVSTAKHNSQRPGSASLFSHHRAPI